MRNVLLFFIVVHLSCSAAPLSFVQQADNLRLILRQADEAYYNHHSSLMSDAAYDALRSQYDRLAAEYPELASASPVGAPPSEPSNHVVHAIPILSLQKAYTDEAVETFLENCGTNLLYCVEPKIDGLTVVLSYCDGLLVQAATRGDGKTGVDVTSAILASGVVPVALTNAPAQLDVRGEVLLPFPAFEALNRRRAETGQSPLKSPRNTAAGTLNLSDYAEIANRGLAIQLFDVLATEPMPATHTEALALLESVGLPTIESRTVAASDVLSTVAALNQQRAGFLFPTDGVVIKLDDRAAFEHLGATAHHPHGALARKYKDRPVETRLLGVDWARGATGKSTPIARFEPVELQGATTQNATLHNLAHIRAMDLRIGDCIQVIRAGGAVPEIIGVCPERRTGSETPIPDPSL
ncbi:MAG: hypothetical protein K9M54_00325 [Kiritimatiellales bacterium]|nr:hypothetical protein [Kiritimatiellales bacterium]